MFGDGDYSDERLLCPSAVLDASGDCTECRTKRFARAVYGILGHDIDLRHSLCSHRLDTFRRPVESLELPMTVDSLQRAKASLDLSEAERPESLEKG